MCLENYMDPLHEKFLNTPLVDWLIGRVGGIIIRLLQVDKSLTFIRPLVVLITASHCIIVIIVFCDIIIYPIYIDEYLLEIASF